MVLSAVGLDLNFAKIRKQISSDRRNQLSSKIKSPDDRQRLIIVWHNEFVHNNTTYK